MLNNSVFLNNFTDNVSTPIQRNNQLNTSNIEPFNIGVSGWQLDGDATITGDLVVSGNTTSTISGGISIRDSDGIVHDF
jgi:hypothetical protein